MRTAGFVTAAIFLQRSSRDGSTFWLPAVGPRVKEVIERRSCQLLFLPAYSPDFSPIEEAFSKLKTILRRAGARTREALQEAIIEALPRITAQDALGWFLHCGYPAPSAGTQLNL